MSGVMLPTTRAEAGSGVRRNGRTAAAWLGVNGTSETEQPGQVGHRAVEVAVAVDHGPDEVPEQLEADRAVERAPGQQGTDADRLVDRRVLAAEDVDGVVADQPRVVAAGGRGQRAGPCGVTEDPPQDTVPAASRVGVLLGRILGDAARDDLLPDGTGDRDPSLISADAAAVLGGDHPSIDDAVRVRALLAWSSLYGTLSFELFGHFVGSVEDGDRYFDRAMTELAALIGL